ncbi:MAG TPA: protein kinase [Kofleriaceae bacterium]|nr:protein kinase [Kofleriaceae bacterium]
MQPGTVVAGKYRVERIIGRGGMGLVVEATHLGLGHRVALKFLAEGMASDQTALARFRREGQAAAALKSEHICRVFDVGVDGKTPFIVMEMLNGTDLARLSKVRALDVPTAALYVRQACLGLAEAHAAKIIHRDLKPGNLFITRRADGSALIKVLDFGVAKAPEESDIKLTGTSNVVGSPGFMSPEQFRSSKTVDGRTDVWSLGVILYKLVSGRLPFKADSFAEFALAITRDPVPPLPEASPEFEAVIGKCLEKDPAKRYPDVLALAEALAPFAAQARGSAPTIPVDAPASDEVMSGVGSLPDSATHTLLGTPQRLPAQPAKPQVTAPAKPAGVAAAKATMLGVSQAGVKPIVQSPDPVKLPLPAPPPTVAPGVSPLMKPTAAETAVPSPGTMPGTVAPRFVPVGELPPGTVVGEYKIDAKIGEGGMGIVYSATHPLIGKRAAIKVISAELGTDPVLVQRFVQEARSVNQIGHPNIVDVFAFGKLPDNRNYFVMEYLQGESLRARLTRTFMSTSDAIQILDEIAGALEAAHEKGIVHRDLKPDNVYLASVRGNFIIVKLLDFGIAKLVTEGGIAKTSTGEMMGTPGYLSPEQARGKNVDYRTDVYALGCMMYEMITGRVPFQGESPMDIVMMHITTPPEKPSTYKPDIPPLLEQVILEMLDKDPQKRPSLGHLRNVFAELVASGLVLLEPGSASTFRSDLMRRRGDTENRTPRGTGSNARAQTPTPAPPVAVPTGQPNQHTLGRRRNASPSDAPTQIAFTPGPNTITPANEPKTAALPAQPAPRKSRTGLIIAIVLVAAAVPAVTIALGLMKQHDSAPADAAAHVVATASDGAVAAVVADAPAADAAVAAVTVDAAVAARDVIIRINVPSAKVEIDGAPVLDDKGVVRVQLTDGPHRIAASASGRTPIDKTVDVSASANAFSLVLERAKSNTKQHPAGQGSGSGQGSAVQKDYTVDPFKE